jgi:hypothetical protein
MEKLNCKFCNHLQKVKDREVKCGVCLKKGFNDTNKFTENEQTDNNAV